MSAKRRARHSIRVGDVFRVDGPGWHGYIQYVGRHPTCGCAIWVIPRCYREKEPDLAGLREEEGYIAFYPLHAALSEGLVTRVGRSPLPEGVKVPDVLHRNATITSSGEVEASWIIETADGKEIVRETLTEDERRLPMAEIWNHAFLLNRIASGWRPSQERAGAGKDEHVCGDRKPEAVGDEPASDDKPEKQLCGIRPQPVQHYLYFPNESTARSVASELKERGFDVTCRLGGDLENWLLLVTRRQKQSQQEFEKTVEFLENLAAQHHGEYDGWETEL